MEELAPDVMCFETLPTCATFEDSPRVAVVWGCKTIRLGPGAATVVVLLVVTTVDVPVAGDENICNRPSGICTNCCPGSRPLTCILPSAERTICTFC